MKKILFALTALLLCSMFLACGKKDTDVGAEVSEPSFSVEAQESTINQGETVVFQFSSVEADQITFFSGEEGSRHGVNSGTVIKTTQSRLVTYTHTYAQPGTYTATFLASNKDKHVTQELQIVVAVIDPEPEGPEPGPHPEVAAFTVTWALTAGKNPVKSEVGAIDVTAHDMYAGTGYRDQEHRADGFIFAEGINRNGDETHGAWVGRTTASIPNAKFTAPVRTTAPIQPEGFETDDMYLEFSIDADQGRDLTISEIKVPIGFPTGSGTGTLRCALAYSLDGFSGDAGSVNYIIGEEEPVNFNTYFGGPSGGTFEYAGGGIVIPQGGSLKVRFMIWRRLAIGESIGSNTFVRIGQNVVIKGTSHQDPL